MQGASPFRSNVRLTAFGVHFVPHETTSTGDQEAIDRGLVVPCRFTRFPPVHDAGAIVNRNEGLDLRPGQ